MKKLIAGIEFFIAAAALNTTNAQGEYHQPVKKVEAKQQMRIRQGVRSGRLTPREAARLEGQQAMIRHDERFAKIDGMSPRERAYIKGEQMRASKNIYMQKHDKQCR